VDHQLRYSPKVEFLVTFDFGEKSSSQNLKLPRNFVFIGAKNGLFMLPVEKITRLVFVSQEDILLFFSFL
jgi:hypothetical protein